MQNAAEKMARELLGMATDTTVPEGVRLTAIKDALDRAGLKPVTAVDLEVSAKPWEAVFEGITKVVGGPRNSEDTPALESASEDDGVIEGEYDDDPLPEDEEIIHSGYTNAESDVIDVLRRHSGIHVRRNCCDLEHPARNRHVASVPWRQPRDLCLLSRQLVAGADVLQAFGVIVVGYQCSCTCHKPEAEIRSAGEHAFFETPRGQHGHFPFARVYRCFSQFQQAPPGKSEVDVLTGFPCDRECLLVPCETVVKDGGEVVDNAHLAALASDGSGRAEAVPVRRG